MQLREVVIMKKSLIMVAILAGLAVTACGQSKEEQASSAVESAMSDASSVAESAMEQVSSVAESAMDDASSVAVDKTVEESSSAN